MNTRLIVLIAILSISLIAFASIASAQVQPVCGLHNCFSSCGIDGNVHWGECSNGNGNPGTCVVGNVAEICMDGCSGGVCSEPPEPDTPPQPNCYDNECGLACGEYGVVEQQCSNGDGNPGTCVAVRTIELCLECHMGACVDQPPEPDTPPQPNCYDSQCGNTCNPDGNVQFGECSNGDGNPGTCVAGNTIEICLDGCSGGACIGQPPEPDTPPQPNCYDNECGLSCGPDGNVHAGVCSNGNGNPGTCVTGSDTTPTVEICLDGCEHGACKEQPPACGDNEVNQNSEECDDGPFGSNTCSSQCKFKVCGDAIINQNHEQCDDGNNLNGDGCSAQCTIEECGNAIVDHGEECDDGNKLNYDQCTTQCKLTVCGDNLLSTYNSDGVSEQCDDGNTQSGDGCSAFCQAEICGDNIIHHPLGEQCDDGNTNNGDGCNAECKVEVCGNAVVDHGEQCDDGNSQNYDGCSNHCVFQCTEEEISRVKISEESCDSHESGSITTYRVATRLENCEDSTSTVTENTCVAQCTPGAEIKTDINDQCPAGYHGEYHAWRKQTYDNYCNPVWSDWVVDVDECTRDCTPGEVIKHKERELQCDPGYDGIKIEKKYKKYTDRFCSTEWTEWEEVFNSCVKVCEEETKITCEDASDECPYGGDLHHCTKTITSRDCSVENKPFDKGSCNPTPICGNEIEEHGEQCDLGDENGQICAPGYEGSCQWCSNECKTVVETGASCGDGIVQSQHEECEPIGSTQHIMCGLGGSQEQVCNNQCDWEDVDECKNEGDCKPGDVDTQSCGVSNVGECQLGTQSRVCKDDYTWDNFGQCVGNIDPVAEICDGLDNDCNGTVDDYPICQEGPSLTPIPDFTILEGETLTFQATANDPNNDPLTFSLVGDAAQNGATITSDGAFSFTTSVGMGGTVFNSNTVTVTDGLFSDSDSFKITVTSLPEPPQPPTPTSREQFLIEHLIVDDDCHANVDGEFLVYFTVKNQGSKLEDVTMIGVVDELALRAKIGPMDLKGGEEVARFFRFDAPVSMEPGYYNLRFYIDGQDFHRIKHREFFLDASC